MHVGNHGACTVVPENALGGSDVWLITRRQTASAGTLSDAATLQPSGGDLSSR